MMGGAQGSSDEQIAAVRGYRRIEEIVPGHWVEGDVVANGARQHYYRTGGDKPPLVLLHGILAGGRYWTRVARALEQDHDVIMLDARGHGGSEGIASGLSYELLAADVAGVIRALGLARPSLLGHSMGGVTAALVAARYPELVRAIVIEDAAWRDSARMEAAAQSEGYRAWLDSYLAYLKRLKTQTHKERLVAALGQLPPGTAVWPEEEYVPWVEVQAALDLDLVRHGPAVAAMLRLETPLSEVVKRITCPILLLTGNPARGGSGDPAVVQEIVAAWHGGRHVPFADAGHLIHLDQFERFIAVVRDFLSQEEAGDPG
jgi:pimeloyl-ACP methyl ester carboxylesterase